MERDREGARRSAYEILGAYWNKTTMMYNKMRVMEAEKGYDPLARVDRAKASAVFEAGEEQSDREAGEEQRGSDAGEEQRGSDAKSGTGKGKTDPETEIANRLREYAQPYRDLKILHVNNVDLVGERFNGYAMQRTLNALGVRANQAVLAKISKDDAVLRLTDESISNELTTELNQYEYERSIWAMTRPYGRRLMEMPEFAQADVVHYHLIHNGVLSLADLPDLTSRRASVMTIHDPWLATGHCVHPYKCEKWRTGCEECEHIDHLFAMKEDNASRLFELRKTIIENSDLELIVTSDWAEGIVKSSPITGSLKVHKIPFGIDTDVFYPRENRDKLREKLGIAPDDLVLFFRNDGSEFKNVRMLYEAFRRLRLNRKAVLLSVGSTPKLPEEYGDLESRYTLIMKGWENDPDTMAKYFTISDLFLMPSLAETFGMMALESMACGTPVIVCDGTALPGIVKAPQIGISVDPEDADAMARAIKGLMSDSRGYAARRSAGMEHVKKEYSYDLYIKRHLALYRELAKKNAAKSAEPSPFTKRLTEQNKLPMVSIVIPVYNGADYMAQAIDSALSQTYPNTEVIVVNDGSKDGGATDRIARSYGERIRYIKKENGGVATALNAGIEIMRGEYFSWLSHDDLYLPNKVEQQMNELADQEDKTLIVAGGYRIVDKDLNFLFNVDMNQKYSSEQLCRPLFALLHGGINGCAMLIHRSNFERYGLFDPKRPTTQDFALWFAMMRDRPIVYSAKENVVLSRSHEEQGSKALIGSHITECDALWIGMMEELTDGEKEELSGSVYRFYWEIYDFLAHNSLYHRAIGYALAKILRLLGEQYRLTGNPCVYDQALLETVVTRDVLENLLPAIRKKTEKKRIAIAMYSREIGGGLNRILLDLAGMLSARYDVILTCVGEKAASNAYKAHPDVREVYIPWKDGFAKYYAQTLLALEADAFIGSYNCSAPFLEIYGELRNYGIRSIAWNHEYYFLPYWRRELFPCLPGRNEALSKADLAVWIAKASARFYSAANENGAYVPNFTAFSASGRSINADPDRHTMIAVGRFEDERKGLEPLLRAFSQVRQSVPDAKLIVAGTADLSLPLPSNPAMSYGALRKKLGIPEEAISFKGMVADISPLYEKASVNVLPSVHEGFGLVLIEAAAYGIPSVAYKGSGMDDIVTDGVDGFLVEEGQAADMAKRIVSLMRDDTLYSSMRKKAAEIPRRFSPAAVLPIWLDILDAMLTKNAKDFREYAKVKFAPDGLDAEYLLNRAAVCYEDSVAKLLAEPKKPDVYAPAVPAAAYAPAASPALEAEYASLFRSFQNLEATYRKETGVLQEELVRLQGYYDEQQRTLSWRITKPIRLMRSAQLSLRREGLKATLGKILRRLRPGKRLPPPGKQA